MLSPQRGQALVLSLILMAFTLMAVLFAFNTYQLNNQGTKLQHTADNTAYSLAQFASRDLNFKAYTNRASVANQVAVAQLVGLSSWFSMAKTFTENADRILRPVPYVNIVVAAIARAVAIVDRVMQPALEIAQIAETAVLIALSGAQDVFHFAGFTAALESGGKITAANDPDAKLQLVQNFMLLNRLKDFWFSYQTLQYRNGDDTSSQYQDFKKVIADSRDPFTKRRSYDLIKLDLGLVKFSLSKAGGSTLVDNDGGEQPESWTSMDTISLHASTWSCGWHGCGWRHRERETGWGATSSDSRADMTDISSRQYWGESRDINSRASRKAADEQNDFSGYIGVMPFYSLSNDQQHSNSFDNIVVVITKEQQKLHTTSSISASEANINPATQEHLGQDRLAAMGAAKVYYSRPRDLMQNSINWARSDNKMEYGNLYNPFWQVRLSAATDAEKTAVLTLSQLI